MTADMFACFIHMYDLNSLNSANECMGEAQHVLVEIINALRSDIFTNSSAGCGEMKSTLENALCLHNYSICWKNSGSMEKDFQNSPDALYSRY